MYATSEAVKRQTNPKWLAVWAVVMLFVHFVDMHMTDAVETEEVVTHEVR